MRYQYPRVGVVVSSSSSSSSYTLFVSQKEDRYQVGSTLLAFSLSLCLSVSLPLCLSVRLSLPPSDSVSPRSPSLSRVQEGRVWQETRTHMQQLPWCADTVDR